MTKQIELILKPYIVYNFTSFISGIKLCGDEYTTVMPNTYLTKTKDIDEKIEKRIQDDYINLKDTIRYATSKHELVPSNYTFNEGSIHIIVEKINKKKFTNKDYNMMEDYFNNQAEEDNVIYEEPGMYISLRVRLTDIVELN